MEVRRDVAVVLSGGGMNAMLLELGFLQRLRESSLWERIGVYFGTSAGALGATMAALDRLDDLERFLYELRAEETFRPTRIWRLPLLGTHDYVLPDTIAARLGNPLDLASDLVQAPAEVVVFATDVTQDTRNGVTAERPFELAYSSRTTPPQELAQAILASAAISALVLPLVIDGRVATDGGWVRNFPLLEAYEREDVELVVAFRYEPRYPLPGSRALRAAVARLRRYSRLPAARAVVAELEEAAEREQRGEPAHIVDTLGRLARVAIGRNTELEEQAACARERSAAELRALRDDICTLLERASLSDIERHRLRAQVLLRFQAARFPHDRVIPRITVSGGSGDVHFGSGWRKPEAWTHDAKRVLIERGYRLADEQLRAAEVEPAAQSSASA